MFEREIYTSRDEGGGEDEARDLDLESQGGVGVRMHDDSTTVADCFPNSTERQDQCEEVCFVFEPKEELDDGSEGEEGYEEGVEPKGGIVPIDCVLNWTYWGNFCAIERDTVPHVSN